MRAVGSAPFIGPQGLDLRNETHSHSWGREREKEQKTNVRLRTMVWGQSWQICLWPVPTELWDI